MYYKTKKYFSKLKSGIPSSTFNILPTYAIRARKCYK